MADHSSKLIAVRNAVAEAVEADWGPDGGNAAVVSKRWRTAVPADLPADGPRRLVFVAGIGSAQADVADRGVDAWDYTVVLTVVEPVPAGLDPGQEDTWVDGRVAWVEGLVKRLGDHRADSRPAAFAKVGPDCWTQEQEIVEACDEEALVQDGLFWSLARLTIRDIPDTPEGD